MGGNGLVVIRYAVNSDQSSTPTVAKATAGAISHYDGNVIHTITRNQTFTNTSGSPLAVNFVLVAGGGAGTTDYGGGGGAGGVVSSIPGLMPTTTPIAAVGPGSPGAWTITIGRGGNGTNSNVNPTPLMSGENSVIASPTATLATANGGGGATPTNSAPYGGGPGGSGGGGRGNRTPDGGGEGTSGQGNDGGSTITASRWYKRQKKNIPNLSFESFPYTAMTQVSHHIYKLKICI